MNWLVPMEEKAVQITILIARVQKVGLLQSQTTVYPGNPARQSLFANGWEMWSSAMKNRWKAGSG